jgi:fumarate hydratase, class II
MAYMCDYFREFVVEGRTQREQAEGEHRPIGHDGHAPFPRNRIYKAAAISYAIDDDLTLRQAVLANGVDEELYDKVVKPLALTRPGTADKPSSSAHS